jgi:hypothetical protein
MSRPNSLRIVTQYLRDNLKQTDYDSTEHTYSIEGQTVSTVEAILTGSDAASGQVVVGAHYDSVTGTVGADDNATDVAAALELARLLRGSNPRQAVRLVFFGSRVRFATTMGFATGNTTRFAGNWIALGNARLT